MMDAQGHPLKRIKQQPIFPDDIHAQFLFRCAMSNRSIMARTAILQEYGYRNDYPRCQDYELHVRLAKKYKLGNLPECLVYGRIHPQQITGQTTDLGDAKKQEIISQQLPAVFWIEGILFSAKPKTLPIFKLRFWMVMGTYIQLVRTLTFKLSASIG